jgi:excisionase family DNA binding protein
VSLAFVIPIAFTSERPASRPTKIAFTIEQASEYTGIGRNTLRNLVEWGKLPVLKVGRKVLIKSDILERFMELNEGKNLRDKNDVKAVTRKVTA